MSNTTTCPSCQRPLRLPDSLLGQEARCPACGAAFLAKADAEPSPAPSQPASVPESEPPRRPEPAADRQDRPPEEDDRPVRRRAEEDEDEDRPRRKRRSDYDDHRGTLILAMGICAFVVFPIPFGPIAWYLGNKDLAEIRAGRMDPEGETNTNIGRILGMVATLFFLFVMLLACLIGCVAVVIIGAAK